MTLETVRSLCLIGLVVLAALQTADQKPDFTGVWKTESPGRQEVWTIKHQEPKLEILMKINDSAGTRQLQWSGVTDGKEHAQTVDGTPAALIAKWEGQRLVLETKRSATFGRVHAKRVLSLSQDGQIIHAETKNMVTSSKRKEVWRQQ